MFEDLDLDRVTDEYARACLGRLLNAVEELLAANRALQEENRRLRDENQRLKGEQRRPRIPGNTRQAAPLDYSSEAERRVPQSWTKALKRPTLRIDREQVLAVAPTLLPPDAQFKGYETTVVQDLVLRPDTVCFHKAKWYSPTTGQSYLAPVPVGYEGEFGPGIKALTLAWYFAGEMSEPKIRDVFGSVGIQISAGQVSNLLIQHQESFHTEAAAVLAAGLRSSPWQHLDDTPTRVDGQNHACHVLCNPLYTAYQTTAAKDRPTVLDVLQGGAPRRYLLNGEAEAWLAQTGVARWVREQVARLPRDQAFTAPELDALLARHLPGLGPQQARWVQDALAVAAYHAQTAWPVVRLLVCDDAPQWHGVTDALALCWIHEGRHYKKLWPEIAAHRVVLDDILTRFWTYYGDLRAYQEAPRADTRVQLEAAFEALFATRTGYHALDDRLAKTRAKGQELLQVLAHPEVPLHNNPAELGARRRVRKRDVSFGPRTATGARAWDTFMTLVATTHKLGVSFYTYVRDRLTSAHQVPGLDALITARAPALQLDRSWQPG
jgi:Transposase IS66 family